MPSKNGKLILRQQNGQEAHISSIPSILFFHCLKTLPSTLIVHPAERICFHVSRSYRMEIGPLIWHFLFHDLESVFFAASISFGIVVHLFTLPVLFKRAPTTGRFLQNRIVAVGYVHACPMEFDLPAVEISPASLSVACTAFSVTAPFARSPARNPNFSRSLANGGEIVSCEPNGVRI